MIRGREWATWLFLAGATLVNVLLISGYFLGLLVLLGAFALPRGGWWDGLWYLGAFAAAGTGAFFTYRGLLALLRTNTAIGKWVDEGVLKGNWY